MHGIKPVDLSYHSNNKSTKKLTFKFKHLNTGVLLLNRRVVSLGYHMAQPAGFLSQDKRTDMGIPVFWTTANSDPP